MNLFYFTLVYIVGVINKYSSKKSSQSLEKISVSIFEESWQTGGKLDASEINSVNIKWGFRMGNTCIPVADSFGYLAKLIQLCKV